MSEKIWIGIAIALFLYFLISGGLTSLRAQRAASRLMLNDLGPSSVCPVCRTVLRIGIHVETRRQVEFCWKCVEVVEGSSVQTPRKTPAKAEQKLLPPPKGGGKILQFDRFFRKKKDTDNDKK
jgi:hypothetical protein